MVAITTGLRGVAVGYRSLAASTGGEYNIAIGYQTMDASLATSKNTAVGAVALGSLIGGVGNGDDNTAIGYSALGSYNDATGSNATAVGSLALNALVSGSGCAMGANSLRVATGTNNMAFGTNSGFNIISGIQNSLLGRFCFGEITSGQDNVGFGYLSGSGFQVGSSYNTIIGSGAAITGVNRTASRNTFLGYGTGLAAHGDANVFLGYASGTYETGADKLMIDNRTRTNEADARVKAMMYGVFAATTAAQYLTVNANLGILTSTFGTNADAVIGIGNGTAPTTSPANMIQIFSVDTDDNTASLGLRTEQAVVTEAVVSDRTLKVTINGTIYKVCLKV